MAFGFEEAFDFDRCHAAGAGSGDGLAVDPVLHVPGMKDAFHVGAGSAVRDDVAIFIEIDLPDERLGIRDMTDRDEEPVHVFAVALASLRSRRVTPVTMFS